MSPPRPHLLARSKLARRIDRLVAWMWAKGLTEKPPLDPDHLWEIGARGFSREDEVSIRPAEDVEDFRLRLEIVCRSLREEARLNALGHTIAYGQLTSAIRKRHALGRLWNARPELAATKIAPPIVVLGQMRSGTTRIHRLLAADPAHAGTRFCDSQNPVPRRPDMRPLKGALALFLAHRINPWLEAQHPFGSTRVDEEIGWLAAALSPVALEAQYRIPSFVAFSESRDPAPIYREFARILRTDAAQAGNAGRARVLKCPQFSEDLAALLAQFPDARIVATSRATDDVHASSVSLVASQTGCQSDHAELAEIEREWARKIAMREERSAYDIARFDGKVAQADFAALNRDWQETIADIYAQLDLSPNPAAHAAMEAERRRAAQDGHRKHREQFAKG